MDFVSKPHSTAPVWEYFGFKPNERGEPINVNEPVCRLCFKTVSTKAGNTTNLRSHLKHNHPAQFSELKTKTSAGEGSSRAGEGSSRQVAITDAFARQCKYKRDSAKWRTLTDIAKEMLPDMRKMHLLKNKFQDNKYEIPFGSAYTSRKTMAIDCVALTGDHWTSVSNSNYLGVTAQTVCVVNKVWQLASFVLTVEKVNNRHYAVNCADHFFSVVESWKIEQKVTIGNDCARNMMAAARQLPFQHMPCVAHILQRSITVCLYSGAFNAVLAKCRKIVGHFRHSPANIMELYKEQRALDQENEPLIQDVSTRWNSTLFMIRRLLKNKEAVKATLDKQRHKLVLSAAEWTKLEKLAAILEPCRHVFLTADTDLLGGETYVSCSAVLPVSDEDSTYIVKFKTAFMKDLSKQKAALNYDWLKMATVLDPCFKDLKCLPREEREAVWKKLEELLQDGSIKATSEPTDEPPKKKGPLCFSSDSDSDDVGSNALSLYKAEQTISETDCPLQWWSAHAGAHPQLPTLARKYLASPATSVPCERGFSLAGNIIQKKRAALSSENVNRLVCLILLLAWLME
uniref:BED-type domain-containing protein n=1 Tax=Pygocentrus nattereri TaxID=42514 RepID=A0AAR2JYW7_PYGNA